MRTSMWGGRRGMSQTATPRSPCRRYTGGCPSAGVAGGASGRGTAGRAAPLQRQYGPRVLTAPAALGGERCGRDIRRHTRGLATHGGGDGVGRVGPQRLVQQDGGIVA
jgi:hypothetical protein